MNGKIAKLNGVIFEDAQENIKKWGCNDIRTYALVREPDNPHDPNAVRVALFGQYYMGYIPKEISAELAPFMDAGRYFYAEFVQRNESPYREIVGMTIKIVEE